MNLDSSHLVAYAELVGSLQGEKPSAVLERMQSRIEAGDLDLKDVFVALDRTGVEVTDIIRLVRIGKDEAYLTQWRGRDGGTRHTIAALLTEARARADELGVRDLSTRVYDDRMTGDYRSALLDAGFTPTNRRVEYKTPLSQMPPEGKSKLVWKTMTETGEDLVLDLLREASIGTPDGVDTSVGSTAIANLLDGDYASMDPRTVQVGYLDGTAAAVLFCAATPEDGWSTIKFLGVVSSHRGRGIGTQIHLHGIATLRELGGVTYHDGTSEANEAMLRLFAKQACVESSRMEEWHAITRRP
jgi:GNAT superfamily N-acetyltransferase